MVLADQIQELLIRGRVDIISPDKKYCARIILEKMRTAKRFIIDEQTIEDVFHFSLRYPEIIANNLTQIRLPFDKCWIEWPTSPMAEYSRQEWENERIGYYCSGFENQDGLVCTNIGLVNGESNQVSVQLSPVSFSFKSDEHLYLFHSNPDSFYQRYIEKFCAVKDYRYFMMGSAANRLSDETDEEFKKRVFYFREIFKHTMVGPDTAFKNRYDHPSMNDYIGYIFKESAGALRTLLALLYLMNAHSIEPDQPAFRTGKKRWVGNKVVPYLEHRRVKVVIPRPIKDPKWSSTGEAIPKRRHDVMGHWCYRRKDFNPNCDHRWRVDLRGETCEKCGNRRWWKKAHARGDASLGFIIAERVVTRE